MTRRVPVKTHLCAPGHFARSFTAKEWFALPSAGCGWMPDGAGGWLSLKNCPCGSTLAIEMTTEEAVENGMPLPANDVEACACTRRG